jgi:hypothetical protein
MIEMKKKNNETRDKNGKYFSKHIFIMILRSSIKYENGKISNKKKYYIIKYVYCGWNKLGKFCEFFK